MILLYFIMFVSHLPIGCFTDLPLQFLKSLVATLESNLKEYDKFIPCLCTRDPLYKSYNLKWASPLSLINKQSSASLITLEKCFNSYTLLSPSISGVHTLPWLMKYFREIDGDEREAMNMVTSLSFLKLFCLFIQQHLLSTYHVPNAG